MFDVISTLSFPASEAVAGYWSAASLPVLAYGEASTAILMLLCLGMMVAFVLGLIALFKKLGGTRDPGLKDEVGHLTRRVSMLEKRADKLTQQLLRMSAENQAGTQASPQEQLTTPPPVFTEPAPEPGRPAASVEMESPDQNEQADLSDELSTQEMHEQEQELAPDAVPFTLEENRTLDALKAVHPASRLMAAGAKTAGAEPLGSARNKPAPSATKTLEERLGANVFIWIGGISLVLASAFLLKYSFDNNLISPLVRIIIGVVFGFGLLGGAEYMRDKSRRISSALAGASVADLFVCLLAASSLYHLISSTTAFFLMIIVAGGAIVLSLRHGRLVAVLGLLGGFITPAIISSGNQQVGPLLAYLVLLQIGMTLVTGRRGWVGLTTLTLAGTLLWAVFLAFTGLTESHRFMLEGFMIVTAAIYIFGASNMAAGEAVEKQASIFGPFRIAMTGVGAAALLVGVLATKGRFEPMDFAMLGLLGVALLVLGRLRVRYAPMVVLAGCVTAMTLVAWIVTKQAESSYLDEKLPFGPFGYAALAYGLIYGLGAYVAMWGSRKEIFWSLGSVVAAVAFFLLANLGLELGTHQLLSDQGWAWIAVGCGALYAAMAWPVWRTRLRSSQSNYALGILVIGSSAFMMLAAQFACDYPWQVSIWAGLAVALAFLAYWQRIALVAHAAVAVGLLSTLAMFFPGPGRIEFSERMIFNALLPAYALPALAMGAACWFLRGKRNAQAGIVLRFLSIILGCAGVLALVRHGNHPQSIMHGDVTLWEWACYSCAALTMSHLLVVWNRYYPGVPQTAMAVVMAGIGLFDVLIGAGLIANPLHTSYAVGAWPVLNYLLFIYGVPMLLVAMFLVNKLSFIHPKVAQYYRAAVGSIVVLLVFGLLSLEVRQYFHGTVLRHGGVGMAEMYTYSVAWILLGIALVSLGLALGSKSLRYASLVIMLVAIGKVFLLDTAHLEDLYRVISFLGLGLTLLVLGYVYQKFVFKRSALEE